MEEKLFGNEPVENNPSCVTAPETLPETRRGVRRGRGSAAGRAQRAPGSPDRRCEGIFPSDQTHRQHKPRCPPARLQGLGRSRRFT